MPTLLTLFCGLALFVSCAVLGLAIYTRPWNDKRCHECMHYEIVYGANPNAGRQACWARVTTAGAAEGCQSQRMPAPKWVPIAFTGRCGPRARFFVPR
jgi:hypothetical protein